MREEISLSASVVGIGLQTFYSIQHIQSAAYHARRAGRLESRYGGSLTSPVLTAIKAEVGSALFAAVAFLEATANELFADAAVPGGGHLHSLSSDRLQVISTLGAIEAVDRSQVIPKFEILLSGAGAESVPRGGSIAQAVTQLVALRNGLTHYKAGWFDVGSEGMTRPGSWSSSNLGRGLQNKFLRRKHASPSEADAWIGYGCARWATSSALRYTDEVFSRLKVKPIYDHVRGNLRF